MSKTVLNTDHIETIEQALAALGVTEKTLTGAERVALDDQGFVVLRDVFAAAELNQLRTIFEEAVKDNSRGRAAEASQSGTRHASDLLARGAAVQSLCFHPRILAAVHHIIRRRFSTPRITGRDPLPGYGQQGLHADWFAPGLNGKYDVATAIGLLDEFTQVNGATRVVPGTHRVAVKMDKRVADPAYVHAQQLIVTAPAGAALVFNGHLWHSATRNQSSQPRRTLQYTFVAHEFSRMNGVNPQPVEAINPAIRFLLS